MKRAPAGLGSAGRRLWRRVGPGVESSPVALELLGEACRLVDELARLHADLAAGALTVDGSMGQPRSSPLLAEIRRHLAALRELLAALPAPIPDPVDDPWDAIARELTAGV